MDATSPIRVLIADDHPLMRAGLAGEINAQPDMCVVAEAGDGTEAIKQFRQHRPDVTLMDVRMPGVSGIQAIETLRADFPVAKFVILTTSAGDVSARRALQAGAVGYLLKNLLRTELIEVIRGAHVGKRRIPADVATELAQYAVADGLSPRELDILAAVAKGKANKIIASDLHITENTVKNHVKSILSKLDASDRTDAVMIGLRRGYLEM